MTRHIILIGFMGCGKSCVAKKLNAETGITWLDTDLEIEKMYQDSVSALFEKHGELIFRSMETNYLKRLLKTELPDEFILSTGGGLPVLRENSQLLQKLGTIYYLKASPETIYERLKDDRTRPLLANEHPRQTICELMKKREPEYKRQADYVIDTDEKSIEEIVNLILDTEEMKG